MGDLFIATNEIKATLWHQIGGSLRNWHLRCQWYTRVKERNVFTQIPLTKFSNLSYKILKLRAKVVFFLYGQVFEKKCWNSAKTNYFGAKKGVFTWFWRDNDKGHLLFRHPCIRRPYLSRMLERSLRVRRELHGGCGERGDDGMQKMRENWATKIMPK